ncbi:MAG: toprim domain-containing protein [Candidatus Anstonellales archaeon]
MLEGLNEKYVYEMELTKYVDELRQRSDKSKLLELSSLRGFSMDIIEECGIFYIGNMAEMILTEYEDSLDDFGVISSVNGKPIFNNRYIIPIKNSLGLIQNLVGYSSVADERYIYANARYYRRRDTLWGLENIHLAYDLGYAILTEGITDAIRLRDLGYKNTFAMCGTHKSDFIIRQLNRCRYGIIRIPDRDRAGQKALKGWEFNKAITIYPYIRYKDIDEMCRETSNIEIVKNYIEHGIELLVKGIYNQNLTIL